MSQTGYFLKRFQSEAICSNPQSDRETLCSQSKISWTIIIFSIESFMAIPAIPILNDTGVCPNRSKAGLVLIVGVMDAHLELQLGPSGSPTVFFGAGITWGPNSLNGCEMFLHHTQHWVMICW